MASPTTTTEQSLDALLNELVANADDWASLKSDHLLDSPASPSSADGQAHPCFDQLSRAISSHVTDLLMRRLRLSKDKEEENEDTDDEDRPWIDERGRERRGRGFAAASLAQPPSTAVSRAGSSCSLATIGSRYHSENRLDRAYPSPRPGETPLENRASRLRRMSIERRQAERNTRSAAASPMPQRRAHSRRSSGCGQ